MNPRPSYSPEEVEEFVNSNPTKQQIDSMIEVLMDEKKRYPHDIVHLFDQQRSSLLSG